jgi:hypothetical protein
MEAFTTSQSHVPLNLLLDSVVAGLLLEFAAMSKLVEKRAVSRRA